MSWAALLLAAALLIGSAPGTVRVSPGGVAAAGRPDRLVGSGDPLAVASSLDVLAACLSSGMAVATAAAATAPYAPADLARLLRRAAELLALGADAATAWSPRGRRGGRRDDTEEALARLARRSASSGAALAQGVAELAARSRQEAADSATASAERASVLIAGPLGLCYLPAFLCLGVVPVVAGLAGDVLRSGVL